MSEELSDRLVGARDFLTRRMKSHKSTLQNGAGATEHIPLLSIIIPVWNREDTIERCLDSILSQDFQDYEIIAVDDGSTDRSVQVMTRYDDPRLRVIQHEANVGSYAARNTAICHARAGWIVKIDSDDAMLPGALHRIAEMTATAPDDAGLLGLSYRYDNGGRTPDPSFPSGYVGLEGWLRFLQVAKKADFLQCFRRAVFEDAPMPTDGRGSIQMMMRIAAHWKIRIDSCYGGVMYTTADNRLSQNKALLVSQAGKLARAHEAKEILQEFGDDLREYAPRMLHYVSYRVGWWYLLAGCRFKGAAWMLRYLLPRPLDLKTWAWLVIGLIGPGALCWVIKKRSRS